MNRPLRPYVLIALAAVVIGILENVFFGADHGGLKHHVSVGFFFLAVAGVLTVIALAILGLVRRVRSPAVTAAAATTRDESITVIIAGTPGAPGLVIARGAVNDTGTVTPNDSDTDTLAFPDGTLLIEETGTTTFQPPAPPTCLARFSTTGAYTVVGGTGRFRHAAGSGTSIDYGIELTNQSSAGCINPSLFVYDKAELRGSLTIRKERTARTN